MPGWRFSVAVSALLGVAAVAPVHAQDTLMVINPSCVSSWNCIHNIRPPLGFYVDTVSQDGRYVKLEDGTIWEVQSDFRAVVAGWQHDDFIDVRRIAAPNENFEWLFTKGGRPEWKAAVRFTGRERP